MENNKNNLRELTTEQREGLLRNLKKRFDANMSRHEGLDWAEI